MSLICPHPKRFLQLCSSEGVKLSECVSTCVCQHHLVESVSAWAQLCAQGKRRRKEKKEKNLCVCVSLLSLASNWIFCPEFVPPLCGRKAAEGYNSERSHAS